MTFGIAALALVAAPRAAAQTEEEGRDVFEQNCQSCHQPGGVGLPGTFPPLAGNPNVADAAYVEGVIRNGLQGEITVLGETYDGVMPALPDLSDAEIQAVILYLQSLGGTTPPDTTVPSGPVAGDPAAGEDLFLGQAGLANGGPACSSCHAAGEYGGASLGPDLTDVYSRLGGEPGLTGWMAAPASPTMQPIFTDRPLDETEIADLVAFFASVDGTQPDRGPDLMLVGGAAGLVVLLAAMTFFFRRPRGRYVDQLRSKA